jgi:hypothetical protein
MTVEILAGPVITHRGAGIGMAGGDLDVPQIDTSVQHGRDERVSEHMWVWAANGTKGSQGTEAGLVRFIMLRAWAGPLVLMSHDGWQARSQPRDESGTSLV